MFSKQADTRNNKSSKTNNKKRNKTTTNNNTTAADVTTPNKKNSKSRKTKRDSQAKPDLIEDIKPVDKSVDLVVLRNTDDNRKSENVKRYSDSFVLGDDNSKNSETPKLSRAASGFIFAEEEKLERRRRFSDIFKYGALKSYNSCDNLKILPRTMEGKITDEIDGVVLRETKKVEVVFKAPEKKKETIQVTNTNNSYLKRVKSKIYKNKNEGVGNSTLPTMPDISETTTKTKKIKNKKNNEIKQNSEEQEVRKTFDFRLIRQSSNLERIRPRSFAPKKCSSNTGIPELNDSNNSQEKPILVKSKSSSAISLNLLRTRRNKILEQVKNRNCKVVENEFDFIPFGNSLRSSQRLYGSQTLNTLNNNVDVAKLTACINGSLEGKLSLRKQFKQFFAPRKIFA